MNGVNDDDDELEKDVLKLQVHSIPLNLNWNQNEVEEDSDEDFSQFHRLQEGATSQEYVTQSNGSIAVGSPVYDSQDEGSDDEELIDLSANFSPTPLNLLKLNFAYQEVVEQQIAVVNRLLQENHYKKSILMESLNRVSFGSEKPPRLESGLFNKLLFKDERGLGPTNPDLERIRVELGPGFVPNFFPTARWKKSTEQALLLGIIGEARRVQMEPLLAHLEYLQEKMLSCEDEEKNVLGLKMEDLKKKMEEVKVAPQSELVGDRWQDWDWDSISNIFLNNQQDPLNCSLYWKNYLHPSINHAPWSKHEDEKLVKLIQHHKDYDWRKITEELGTGRTVFDVVKRYQLKINTSFKSRPWTPEEDAQLLKLVKKYRVGTVIPYTKIALHMKNRYATQLVHRWTKSLDPNIKREKFSPQEDAALLRAVRIHGQKWARIRDLGLLPGRSDAQLRERYINVLGGARKSCWTREDDLLLISLVEEIGEGNWSAIAARMEGRADCQCLRRWGALKKHMQHGNPLTYRKDVSKVMSLMRVRENLRRAIEAEHDVTKEDRKDVSRVESQKEDGNDAMHPDALMKVYNNLIRSRKVTVVQRQKQSTRDVAINKELLRVVRLLYQPKMVVAKSTDTQLGKSRADVLKRSEVIGAKEIFVHFIKALNVNAERTLETIRRKTKAGKYSDLLSKSPNKGSSPPFSRNLYLSLCAPNRATVQAYRSMTKDRDRRVNRAKVILQLPGDKDATTDVKFDPQALLAELRSSYKYKIFRSRFNALFTWPTLLSSLVPYLRRKPEGSLYPAVKKRKYPSNDSPPKKIKR